MTKVINIISDTNIGGAGKILLSYLKNYDRQNFDMGVIVPAGSLLIDEIKKLDVPCFTVDALKDKSYKKEDVLKVLEVLEREQPDIVHCHGAMSGRVAGKKFKKCKVISTRHSVFEQPNYKKTFPTKQILGLINNHYSDRIIAVSPAAKDNITEIGADENKITVVFNGVEKSIELTPEQRAEVRKSYGISNDSFVCAIIARLELVKGHSYILECAKMLKDKNEDVVIIIAGIGAIENELRAKAKEMGLTNVIFTGFIKEIYNIENIMDLQLNASYGTEATSLSLLEGMSLGIPAVVSDFGGNPYVIENGVNGLVVPKKDAKAMFDAILKAKNDKELYAKMAEGSRRVYGNKFTVDAMAREIEKVYNEVKGENR